MPPSTTRPYLPLGLAVCLLLIGIATRFMPAMQAAPLPQSPAPTPPALTATAGPTLTPTRTATELIGVDEQAKTGSELVQRYGWWGAGGLLVLIVAIWFLRQYSSGFGEAVKERGKRTGSKPFETLDRRNTARAQQRALNAGTAAYLRWLLEDEELKYLPFIPGLSSADQQATLELADVYVPLRVVEREQIEQFRKLTLGDFDPSGEYQFRRESLAALQQSQRVYRLLSDATLLPSRAGALEITTTRLLIGDAGSGKTSTLHYGARLLAYDRQQGSADQSRTKLQLYTEQPLLPFYIRLTLVADYIRKARAGYAPDQQPSLHNLPSRLLIKWLSTTTCEHIKKQGVTLTEDFAESQLVAGNCLVMLDGLDETGDAAERADMLQLIANLVHDYPNNRYVVASRPFEDLNLPNFEERHLSPLNDEEIKQLLRNWWNAAQQDVPSSRRLDQRREERMNYLLTELERNPRLFDMATNPLLLTTMALLAYHGDELPRERAKIYEKLLGLALIKWRAAQKGGGRPGEKETSLELYREGEASIQRRLQDIAAWMLEQQRREIRLGELQALLRPDYLRYKKELTADDADDYIRELVESLALHSGLVQRRDRGYTFSHFTLQEYLTARAYDQREDGVDGLFARRQERRWRETILLAVGHWAASGDPAKAQQLIRKLLNDDSADALLLAGDALDDANAASVLELAPLVDTTAARLRALAFDPAACPDPAQRNRAATLLDRLGADNRPELELSHPDYWAAEIQPGPFRMGEGKAAFTYHIRYRYRLARFPVTNRQYADYLATLPPEEAEQRRPGDWPGNRYRAGEGNHPVVGVDWHDATAFAGWVNDTCLSLEQRAAGEQISLPTEPEWERAAAYPARIERDGERREYPWGAWEDPHPRLPQRERGGEGHLTDAPDDSILVRANTAESGIGGTSAVGIFPHGAAECGAHDLAGNVWEWCATPYQRYPLPEDVHSEMLDNTDNSRTYVLRGGSWYNTRDYARCSYRRSGSPVYFLDNFGFRLARRSRT